MTKSNTFLDNVQKQIIVLLNTTRKIDIKLSENLDSFIEKIENEGLNNENILDFKRMSQILDNKIISKNFEEKLRRNKFENFFEEISKKNISQKQKKSIISLISKLKNGESFDNILEELSFIFSEEIQNEGISDKRDFDSTIDTISKSITRDLLKITNQLKLDYPKDKHTTEIFMEVKAFYNNKNIKLFNLTDLYSKVSLHSMNLQKIEKNKCEKYLLDVNSKLELIIDNIHISNKNNNKSVDLTQEIQTDIKNVFQDIKKSTKNIKEVNELKDIVILKLDSIENKMESFTKKQISLQNKQKEIISDLENNLNKSLIKQENLQRSLEEEKEVSSIDNLTKLPNRKSYTDYINKAHTLWLQKPYNLSIVLLDIDKFKNINDTFGHNVGDAALKKFSNIIKELINDKYFFCRYGGEEFILVCPNLSKLKAAYLAEIIRNKIYNTKFKIGEGINRKYINITASFGISEFSKNNIDIASTFEKADKALYFVKKDGRNSVGLENNGLLTNYSNKNKT
jgi:diguanylate cyclase (GGDEF)-like protein